MRTALTMLGIIIGVGAVIAMMEIGIGSSNAIKGPSPEWAPTTLSSCPVPPPAEVSASVQAQRLPLPRRIARRLFVNAPLFRAAAPLVHTHGQVIYQGRNWVPPEYLRFYPRLLKVREWTDIGRRRYVLRQRRPQRYQGLRHRPNTRNASFSRMNHNRKGNPHIKHALSKS